MAKIFISYRRNDCPFVAQALNERLQQRFGQESVFLDVDTIPPGVDFREHIDQAVGQCDVLGACRITLHILREVRYERAS